MRSIACFAIFTLSPFKLPHYGLPAFPAMALLVARLWDEAIERPAGAPRSFTLLVPSLLTVAGLAVAALLVWRGVLGVSNFFAVDGDLDRAWLGLLGALPSPSGPRPSGDFTESVCASHGPGCL